MADQELIAAIDSAAAALYLADGDCHALELLRALLSELRLDLCHFHFMRAHLLADRAEACLRLMKTRQEIIDLAKARGKLGQRRLLPLDFGCSSLAIEKARRKSLGIRKSRTLTQRLQHRLGSIQASLFPLELAFQEPKFGVHRLEFPAA